MPETMNKRERVAAALAGDEVDHAPIAFWGHDYAREWSAEDHVAQTLEFVRRYDLDYVKINPRFSYLMEAWGGIFAKSDLEREGPKAVRLPVVTPFDLERLQSAPAWSPSMVEQLVAASAIVRGLRGDRPIVQTLFSPLGVLGNLVAGQDGQGLRPWFSEHPARVHAALAAIAASLKAFGAELLNTGVDGVFFAPLSWASRDNATIEEYREFGRPYDLQVLSALRDARLLILHVCREHNMVEALRDYPVHVVHWDSRGAGNPGMAAVAKDSTPAVAGGISNRTLLSGTAEEVTAEVRSAIDEMGGRRLLLAGSCSINPATPETNIRAAIDAAREGS
jgi:uroporphyrinogen decarboxylase